MLFYSARVSLLGALAGAALLLARPIRQAPRRLGFLALFAVGAGMSVAPVVPVWLDRPASFFHRMADSFSLYDPATGWHPGVLTRVTGEPMQQTLAMFWPVLSPGRGVDLAGQGTLDVSFGPALGVLLLAGLLLTLADGPGTAGIIVVWLTVMLLGCGVFAQATPWYTRLVPVTAAAALLMARAVDGLVGLVPAGGSGRRLAAAAAAGTLLVFGAIPNVRKYVRFEESSRRLCFQPFGSRRTDFPKGRGSSASRSSVPTSPAGTRHSGHSWRGPSQRTCPTLSTSSRSRPDGERRSSSPSRGSFPIQATPSSLSGRSVASTRT